MHPTNNDAKTTTKQEYLQEKVLLHKVGDQGQESNNQLLFLIASNPAWWRTQEGGQHLQHQKDTVSSYFPQREGWMRTKAGIFAHSNTRLKNGEENDAHVDR